MIETPVFEITRIKSSNVSKVDFNDLKFGKIFADHMFVSDYADGHWQDFRIEPFGNIEISPAMSAIHYGQSFFEGLKAYRGVDGAIRIFRPWANAKRFNISAERMCMPTLDEEIIVQSMAQLVHLDSNWVSDKPDASLYLRPFMFATDNFIGIRPSDTYRYMVFTCPVGAYYSEPVRVMVEKQYTRAAEGGMGYAKAAGNYGGALYPTRLAQEKGYHQILWTDAKEHRYFEEAGTMNVVFMVDGKIITPKTGSSILSGITRDSILTIARHWGIEVEERKVSVEEIRSAIENGKLQDAFGAGTAATIAPIGVLNIDGKDYQLPAAENREFSTKVKHYLSDIKLGKTEDIFGWNLIVG